jgi:hypothetical protein
MTIYAQTTGEHSTNSATFVPIPGLTVTIPEGVGTLATIILNLPLPYAKGNDFPGANVGIAVNGTMSHVVGGFTYNEKQPASSGRVPTTLVVGVPLGSKAQTIQGMWSGVRGSKVIIDTPATLTAVLTG